MAASNLRRGAILNGGRGGSRLRADAGRRILLPSLGMGLELMGSALAGGIAVCLATGFRRL